MADRRRLRYGRFTGGPDPLAPPVDLAEALDAVSDGVMDGYSPEAVRTHFRGLDLGPLVEAFDGEHTVTTGERVTAPEFLDSLPQLSEPGLYEKIGERVDAAGDAERAGAVELALEGLFLVRRLSKESGDGETIYG